MNITILPDNYMDQSIDFHEDLSTNIHNKLKSEFEIVASREYLSRKNRYLLLMNKLLHYRTLSQSKEIIDELVLKIENIKEMLRASLLTDNASFLDFPLSRLFQVEILCYDEANTLMESIVLAMQDPNS
jgi:hypothetical protein